MRRDQRHLKPSTAFAGNGRPQGSSHIVLKSALLSLFLMVRYRFSQ